MNWLPTSSADLFGTVGCHRQAEGRQKINLLKGVVWLLDALPSPALSPAAVHTPLAHKAWSIQGRGQKDLPASWENPFLRDLVVALPAEEGVRFPRL